MVTQHVDLRHAEKHVDATSGADAALAALKQSLASFAHDKEAKKCVYLPKFNTLVATDMIACVQSNHKLHSYTRNQEWQTQPIPEPSTSLEQISLLSITQPFSQL